MRTYTLLLFLVFALNVSAEELPVEHFGHLPLVAEPEVSPDGQHVAVIVYGDQGPTVNVAPFRSRDLTPVARLRYGEDRIDWIEWANNDRLLIASSSSMLIVGDRVRVSRLFSVERDGDDLQEIRRRPDPDAPAWMQMLDTATVIDWLIDDPEHVLMQLYDELDEAWAVYRVNIYKNKFKKEFPNTYDVSRWFTDGRGNVMFGVGYEDDRSMLWYRPNEDADWEMLYEFEYFVDERFAPILVDGDKAIVLSDHEVGRMAVWRYDIATGEYEELLFAADGYDVEDAILSVDRSEVIGATYFADYREDHYFDEARTATANLVAKSFATYETAIASWSKDRKRMIVQAVRDNSPPKFYWLDLATGQGGIWFSQFPYLENKELAKVTPFEFETQDGMKLNGYLTLPVNAGDSKPKTIVFPHGGPHARDYQYFDPYVQYFANRGYAVLQVNFRGSSGFGNDYQSAGYREWGQAMQQDVYDAIDWLAEQDVANTDEMCMVGGSYGGYVALVAAYQRPNQFACIVSMAGIANLQELVAMETKFTQDKSTIAKSIGDPTDNADERMMDTNSALYNIAPIKAPILLIHGTYDTQVRVKQSRDFHRRAEQAGVDIEYLELAKGTHYFDEYDNRLAVFEALDEFLGKHL